MRIRARHLKPGNVIWHNGEQRTIVALMWLNGKKPVYFGGPEGTKVAIELRLNDDPEPHYVYPAAWIDQPRTITNGTMRRWHCWVPSFRSYSLP